MNNAGEGQLEIMINKGSVPNSVRMIRKGVYQVSFVPRGPQPHTVDIKFNGELAPGMYKIQKTVVSMSILYLSYHRLTLLLTFRWLPFCFS